MRGSPALGGCTRGILPVTCVPSPAPSQSLGNVEVAGPMTDFWVLWSLAHKLNTNAALAFWSSCMWPACPSQAEDFPPITAKMLIAGPAGTFKLAVAKTLSVFDSLRVKVKQRVNESVVTTRYWILGRRAWTHWRGLLWACCQLAAC